MALKNVNADLVGRAQEGSVEDLRGNPERELIRLASLPELLMKFPCNSSPRCILDESENLGAA